MNATERWAHGVVVRTKSESALQAADALYAALRDCNTAWADAESPLGCEVVLSLLRDLGGITNMLRALTAQAAQQFNRDDA